jgi:hypothetical protein
MRHSFSDIRWGRVLGAALAVVVLSLLVLMGLTTAYAFVLAVQARGAPDQAAIQHFAARVSPKLMPWIEAVWTLLVAAWVARRAAGAGIISGLVVGVLAGLLSLTVPLAFGGRLGVRSALFLLIAVALGGLGGVIGKRMGTFAAPG